MAETRVHTKGPTEKHFRTANALRKSGLGKHDQRFELVLDNIERTEQSTHRLSNTGQVEPALDARVRIPDHALEHIIGLYRLPERGQQGGCVHLAAVVDFHTGENGEPVLRFTPHITPRTAEAVEFFSAVEPKSLHDAKLELAAFINHCLMLKKLETQINHERELASKMWKMGMNARSSIDIAEEFMRAFPSDVSVKWGPAFDKGTNMQHTGELHLH